MSASGSTGASPETPAPGWYPDPGNPFLNRWWDGSTWTTTTAPTTPPAPVPLQGVPAQPQQDLSGKAKTSMVLGLIGIVAWLLPIVGLPVTITGLVFGIRGRHSSEEGKAIAGIVLCSVFLFASVANAALGAYLKVTGRM